MSSDSTTRSAIIFDMDGVLVDSEPLHLRATNEVLALSDAELSAEDNRVYLGTNEFSYWTALKERFELPGTVESLMAVKHRATHRLLREELPVMDGVVEFVAAAASRGLKLAVASGSDRDLIDFVLAGSGLAPYIEAIAAGDEVAEPKPHPEIYLLAASRLGIDPAKAIVFEDSINGARSAVAAGMTCIRVITETTRHLAFPPTAGEIHSFRGLRVDAVIDGSPLEGSEGSLGEGGEVQGGGNSA
jgi:HAD superfamily hydrolase (TIGR01509 family)